MPFLEDIYSVLGIRKGGKTGNMLMMGSAICISLSSGMTAIGHVWPTLAIGAYASATGADVNQFQYMLMGIPTGILLFALLLLGFRFLYRPDDIGRIDLDFLAELGEHGIPFALILTKCDKQGPNVLAAQIERDREILLQQWEELPPVFCSSSQTGRGREEILDYIGNILDTI